jgi:glutathione synthase/RimK-type ligase-like ATP-grasp enzyme
MSNVLLTMAEDLSASTSSSFALKFAVDEHDCLHFAQALKALGHQVFFVNWQDLEAKQFKRMFCFNDSQYVDPVELESFDLAFVYKMEGFYFDLPKFYAMLDRLSTACGAVVNNVRTIRHNIDKHYLWQLAEAGVATIPSFKLDESAKLLDRDKAFVLKPFFGERGNGILLVKDSADLLEIRNKEHLYFAQKFMPEIRAGERSLVFLGKSFSHAVIKHPAADNPSEFRCNESLGGTVAVYHPQQEEIAFCERVLTEYENSGYPVHFSRIDILSTENGPVLLEAELLNPSVYANYSNIGAAFGAKLAAYFDQIIQRGP